MSDDTKETGTGKSRKAPDGKIPFSDDVEEPVTDSQFIDFEEVIEQPTKPPPPPPKSGIKTLEASPAPPPPDDLPEREKRPPPPKQKAAKSSRPPPPSPGASVRPLPKAAVVATKPPPRPSSPPPPASATGASRSTPAYGERPAPASRKPSVAPPPRSEAPPRPRTATPKPTRIERPAEPAAERPVVEEDPILSDAKALLDLCEKELARHPADPRAGRLCYEMARLLEGPLRDLSRAADAYQRAAKLLPDHVPSLRGARRALCGLRRHREALPLFDAEVRVTKEPERRAGILYAKGRLLEEDLAQTEEALGAYRDALELDGTSATILKSIERCERRKEAWTDLARTYERLATSVADDRPYRAAITVERAWLAELRADDPALAADLYQAALELDPSAPGALSALKRLDHAQGRWRELCAALAREVALSQDPRVRAMTLARIARIHEETLAEPADAILSLEQAAKESPGDPAILTALARLYERTGRQEDLAATLTELHKIARTDAERVALAHRLGRLHAALGADERAQKWLEAALAADGAFEPALTALGELYERTGSWDPLIKMLLRQAETSTDATVRAAAHVRIGDLLERSLARPDDAATHHAIALGLVQDHEPAFKALTRLHAQAGRWRELCEVYERVVDRDPGSDRAISYLFRIGAVYEDRLGDADGAVHAYQRILSAQPGHLGALQALSRAAERAGKHDVVVDALEREAKRTTDPGRARQLLLRAGEVCDRLLGDPDGAIRRLRQVLAEDPQNAPALGAIGRLYHRAGRWDDLLETWRAELPLVSGGAAVGLLHKMGELCATHLGRPDDAMRFYQQALEGDPEHEPSFQALMTVHRHRGEHRKLAELLTEREKAERDPIEKSRLLVELGQLNEERLSDPARALDLYEQALRASPDLRAARDARTRLLSDAGSWERLTDGLAEEARLLNDPVLAADAKMTEGLVHAYRLNDLQKARTCFEEVLTRIPGHLGALIALEGLHLRSRDSTALSAIYQQLASVLSDPGARTAALRELARVTPDEERAEQTYEALLEVDAADEEALLALAAAAQKRGDPGRAVQVEGRLAAALSDKSLVAHHQARVAELLEIAGDGAALGAYRAALALDPESLTSTRGFTRVSLRDEDPDALREAALREARVTHDLELAIGLLLEAAELRRRAGDGEGAAEDLEKAIELDPSHREAAEQLGTVLVELAQTPRLVELLGRAADLAKPAERGAELQLEVARLHADLEGNLPAAVAAARRALAAVPDHAPAWTAIADYLERNTQWKQAADALEKVIANRPLPAELLQAQLRVARIAEERLADGERAVTMLRAALLAAPDNREALARLARLLAKGGAEEEALAIAQRLVAVATEPKERSEALLQVAHLQRVKGDVGAAESALRDAVGLSGPDAGAGALYRQMIQAGVEPATWAAYLEALATYVRAAEKRGGPLASAYRAIARIHAEELKRPDRAMATLRQAIERYPDDVEMRLELARQLRAVHAHDQALTELRTLLERSVKMPEAWRELAGALRSLGAAEEGLVAGQPLLVLGAATAEELLTLKARSARPASAPPGLLGDAGFREVQVASAFDTAAAELVAALGETLAKMYPSDPARYGVTKRDRLPPRSGDPVRTAAERVALVLGVPELEVYLHDQPARDVGLELGNVPTLFVPRWVEDVPRPGLVYLLARPIAAFARQVPAVYRIHPQSLAVYLAAAGRLVSPGFASGLVSEADLEARGRELSKAMPRRSRKPVETAAGRYVTSGGTNIEEWLRAVHLSLARASLLLADDVVAVVDMVKRTSGETLDAEGTATDLVRFWVSDAAVRFRRAVASA